MHLRNQPRQIESNSQAEAAESETLPPSYLQVQLHYFLSGFHHFFTMRHLANIAEHFTIQQEQINSQIKMLSKSV